MNRFLDHLSISPFLDSNLRPESLHSVKYTKYEKANSKTFFNIVKLKFAPGLIIEELLTVDAGFVSNNRNLFVYQPAVIEVFDRVIACFQK